MVQVMKENISKAKRQALGKWPFQMSLIMRESLLMMKLVVTENFFGVQKGPIKGNGWKIKCMEKEFLYGLIQENLSESILKEKRKDMESTHGNLQRW